MARLTAFAFAFSFASIYFFVYFFFMIVANELQDPLFHLHSA